MELLFLDGDSDGNIDKNKNGRKKDIKYKNRGQCAGFRTEEDTFCL